MENNSDSDYDPGKDDNDDDDDSSKSDKLSESSENSSTKRKKIEKWRKNTKTNCEFFQVYHCSFCNYETHFRYALKKHFKSCNQSNTKNGLKCPLCNKIFTETAISNQYKLPVNVDDKGNNVFHCPFCTLNIDGKKSRAILENYNIKSKPLACTDCGTKIQGINGLKRHMINKHSKTVRYRCEYCEYFSLEPSDLQNHKQLHSHQQDIGLIKCSHCTLDFFTIEDFKEHMRRIEKKNYVKDMLELKKHKQLYSHQQEIGLIKCSHCTLDFSTIEDFKEHLRRIGTQIYIKYLRKERSTGTENCTLLNDLEDNVLDVKNKDNEDDSKFEKEALQLMCSLCQYSHHSEESCYRHIKNKHRAEGYTAVTFFKYHGSVYMGSIVIGNHEENLVTNIKVGNKSVKEKNPELENKCNRMELLNALKLTHSVNTVVNDKENNEVITIQFASDSEDGSILGDNNINISFLEDEQIRQSDKITTANTLPDIEENVLDHTIVIDKQLECTECSYKTKYNPYLIIHKQMAHDKVINGVFKCAHTNCTYFSHVRANFRNHLKKFHKNKIMWFYSKDLNCPDCTFIAKKPADLLAHRRIIHIYPIDEEIKQSQNDTMTIVNAIPEIEEKVLDHNFVINKRLECTECSYKPKYKSYLIIHKQVAHEKLINGGFKCAHKNCTYFSYVRVNFRNHLKKYHKNKITLYYSKDLNCSDCNYIATNPVHLLAHKKVKHKYSTFKSKKFKCPHCSFVTSLDHQLLQHVKQCKKVGTNLSKSKSTVVNCPHCGITINKRASFSTHLRRCNVKNKIRPAAAQELNKNYSKTFSCRYCLKELDKLYQLAWHIYMVHKNTTDLKKWLLKCGKCDFEHYSKVKCHEHGLQHKIPFLTFQKLYQGIPKGKLRMRYLNYQFKDNIDHVSDTSSQKSTSMYTINTKKDLPMGNTNKLDSNNDEECISTAAIDILDWTHSDDEKNVETHKNLLKSEIGKIESTKEVLNRNNENNELFKSDDDDLLKKKAEYYTCSNCSYETNCASHVPLHEKLIHGVRISTNNAKFECPECDFKSKYRDNLKRHLINSHMFDIAQLYNINQEENPTPPKKKNNDGHLDLRQCCQKHTNKYSRAWHVMKEHGDKTELLKWRIECTLCTFSTYSKDQARQHAEARHSGVKEREVVTLNTFYENELCGCFDFKIDKVSDDSNNSTKENNLDVIFETPEIIKIEITSDSDDEANQNKNLNQIEDQKSVPKFRKVNISNKNQKISNKKYVSFNKKSMKKHKAIYVSRQNKFGDKYKISDDAICKKCKNTFEDKYELAIHLYKAHSDKTELGKWAIKCVLCNFKTCWIKNASIHGRTKHGSKNRSTTAIFQIFYKTEFLKVFPFHYESQPYSCDKCDFMTNTIKGIEKHKSEHNRALNVSRVTRNKTATITKNKMESLDCKNELPKTSNAVKDFVGEHFEESNISKINKKQNSNNSQINITVNENEVITIEIVPDKADISTEGERSTENSGVDRFMGECVKTQLINNKKVKSIEVNAKLNSNPEHVESSKLKATKITFKCRICGLLLLSNTLRRHTQIHAKEDGNPNLKVRYSEYRDGKIGATISMDAIPDYVFPKRLDRERSPELEYAPGIDVFSCNECNFKTNQEDELNKHKNLHWTPKKQALFSSQKWFTCSECFFYCFDLDRFKKHREWHKTNPKRTGNIGKLGKASLVLKQNLQ